MGQVVNLRGGWLPPLPRANAGGTLWVRPIDNRPQLAKLPHNRVASPISPKTVKHPAFPRHRISSTRIVSSFTTVPSSCFHWRSAVTAIANRAGVTCGALLGQPIRTLLAIL